ncbi:MAG: dihydroorotase [Clostridiaceae bacterium]|nr:dihydroorotase [Clostridiaceae bacterium]
MELLIKGAKIVDAEKSIVGDVYIREGIISEIGLNLNKNCPIIDAKGLTLMPAFVDTHAHFREPGFTQKEDLLTGSMAAVKGGYTTVNLMPNTKPVCSSMEIVSEILKKSKVIGLVDVHQTISITKDFSGKDISHIDEIEDPCRMITEDGYDVSGTKVMYDAMMKTKEKGLTIMVHCEDNKIVNVDSRLSENLMTWRNIQLAKATKCPIHIAHVSTKESMAYIIDAKKQKQEITCEIMPHHIALTNLFDYKVNPPLRKQEDIDYIIKAIQDGFVDTIGTDHAPHTKEDKEKGAPGISGIETSFSVCYTTLVLGGYITLNQLSSLMSKQPAKIMGLNKGIIVPGFQGDVVLIDLEETQKVIAENFASKGKNTPFDGMSFDGKVITTVKGGKVVYDNGSFILNHGKVILKNWWISA